MLCHEWGKARFPVSSGLMGEFKAALQKHFSQVTQAQLVTQSPQHDEEDNIDGVFERVEEGSSALIEGALAR
jgi:hypothetical protein